MKKLIPVLIITLMLTNFVNAQFIANAGIDQIISLPTTTVTLSGSASGSTATPFTYHWTKLSGDSSATITTPNNISTTVISLIQSVYTFQLAATDKSNPAKIAYDTVQVTVNAATACVPRTPSTHTVPTQAGGTEIFNPSTAGWLPGDTLNMPGGTYDVIQFQGLRGNLCQDLYLRVTPGQTINLTGRFALELLDSFVEVDGTNINVNGVVGGAQFTNVIWENLHITNPAGVGMFMKQNSDSTDYYSYFPHFTMNKIIIRNNYIHDTGGEGMYIGNTDPGGDDPSQNEPGYPPTNMDSVQIYGNRTDSTGWDGIQLSDGQYGCMIHDNTVTNFGVANVGTQQAGIIFGGNTTGAVYNDTVRRGTGNGLEVFGFGLISVHDNIVDTTGHDSTSNGQQSFFSNQYNLTIYPLTFNQTISITNNNFSSLEKISVIRVQNDGGNASNATANSNHICAPNQTGAPIILDPPGSSQTGNTFSCP